MNSMYSHVFFGLSTSRQIPSGLVLLLLFGTAKVLIGQWHFRYNVLIELPWQGLWIRRALLKILAQLVSVSVECFKCPDGRTMNWLWLCFNNIYLTIFPLSCNLAYSSYWLREKSTQYRLSAGLDLCLKTNHEVSQPILIHIYTHKIRGANPILALIALAGPSCSVLCVFYWKQRVTYTQPKGWETEDTQMSYYTVKLLVSITSYSIYNWHVLMKHY